MVTPEIDQSSGNHFIDENHHALLDRLNTLTESLRHTWKEALFRAHTREFISALENHFLHEETILRGAGYCKLDEHTVQHRQVALDIRMYAFHIGDYDSALEFLMRTRTAILNHELFDDQEYWPVFDNPLPPSEQLIQWTQEWETGNTALDRHHVALTNHINRFHRLFSKGRNRERAAQELRSLLAFSELHFNEEETDFGSSVSQAHAQQHKTLIDDLKILISEVELGDYELAAITSHLKYWFLNHLINFDLPAFRR